MQTPAETERPICKTLAIVVWEELGIAGKDWDGLIWKDNSYTQFRFVALKCCFWNVWCFYLSSKLKFLVTHKSKAAKQLSPIYETQLLSVRIFLLERLG
jgi:hypothetical protein